MQKARWVLGPSLKKHCFPADLSRWFLVPIGNMVIKWYINIYIYITFVLKNIYLIICILYIYTRVGWTSMKTNSIFTIDASWWMVSPTSQRSSGQYFETQGNRKARPSKYLKEHKERTETNTSRWCFLFF